MPSNTFFLVLFVVLNLLTMHHAYRIDTNDEPSQGLSLKYENSANDEERLANLYNLKQAEENDSDLYNFIPCHRLSSFALCNKLAHFSRRDTGFLRFGRKR